MVTDVVGAVAAALHDTFGDGYEIYQNDVEQGLKEPCFFVATMQVARARLPNSRYMESVPLDITYFPLDGRDNKEIQTVADQLFDILEFVKTVDGSGALLHGIDKNANITDDVLHFQVTFNLSLFKTEDKDYMETMEMHSEIGG